MVNDYSTLQPRTLDCGTPTGNVVNHGGPFHRSPQPGDALTERALRVWSAGDYDRISAGFRQEAEAFVGRRALAREQEVLDAACGSGNLTIPATRTGANVGARDARRLCAAAGGRSQPASLG